MRKIIVCLLLCGPLFIHAQKKDKNAQKIAATITAANMKKHLYIIAGAEMEGRNTPSPGLEKAAVYIENHFKSLGLVPGNNGSYRQYYPLYQDSIIGADLVVNEKPFEISKDFIPLASNFAAEMRFSEVVFAGYGISDENRDDYKDLKVAGKLVMILDGAPEDYKPAQQGFRSPASSFGKTSTAVSKGAAGLLVVYKTLPGRGFSSTSAWTRNTYRPSQSLFTFYITPAIASAITGINGNIADKMKEGSVPESIYPANIDLRYSKKTLTTQVSNVIALLEGSDKKDEYVFITAHYDHVGKRDNGTIYYGADDDGSGTTAILELAEAFAKAKAEGKGPRRSIVFMTVSGEEKGLWGSAYYANHPIFPLDKTTVDLNIDMIGRTGNEYLKDKDSVNYVYVIGDDKLSSDLAPITDKVNKTYTKLKLDRKYNDLNDPNRFYYRSDHYNFAEKGIPIIFYFDGVHADYHQPTDTPDKINYPMMARRAQLVFYTAWEMANLDQMLKRDMKLEKPKGF